MTPSPPLLLASASPRRHDILNRFNIPHRVIPAVCDEPQPEPGECPDVYACRIAKLKAEFVHAAHLDSTVLAADTVVVMNNTILGKPDDSQNAEKMIRQLSGKTHQVISGVCLIVPGRPCICFSAVTNVRFRNLTESEITWYVGSKDGLDKAGAYGIQSLGGALIDSIDGDWFNVVGLPLGNLLDAIRKNKLDLWPPSSPP